MPRIIANLIVQNSVGSFNSGNFYSVSPKNKKIYNGSDSANLVFIINTFNSVNTKNPF
ncbi:spore germination protein [Bacillus thuringiensis]|nr:spore germination protein [Bacillus thuringiensis]